MSAKKVSRRAAIANREQFENQLAQFLDEHNREATKQYDKLVKKADEVYLKVRDDFIKAVEAILPKEVLEQKLYDFVRNADDLKEQRSENETSSDNLMDTGSVSVPVSVGVSSDSVKLCSEKKNHGLENARTPLQESMNIPNLPSFICPKVEYLRGRRFRHPKMNELAFSVDGSPLTTAPSSSADRTVMVMKEIVDSEQNEFSPQTQEAVSLVRSLIRKKMAYDPENFVELD